VFAEFERRVTIERINAGLARACSEATQLGRPRVGSKIEEKIRKLYGDPKKPSMGKLEIAKQLGVGVGTVQRVLPAEASA
jgi:DNA invertase Pin-like site-specific DNA recombinase